jgi:hypothetical protein
MTPATDSADRPPLQIVPGHRSGEKRNAQLAVNKHPSPRPAFAGLRSAAGWAKMFAAVALAIDRVLKPTDDGTRDGDVPKRTDEPMVTNESRPPEISVKFASPVEQVRDEEFQVKDRDAMVDPTLVEGVDVDDVGRGGCK